MDLPPPPPFHHQPRYGNILPTPDFDRAYSYIHRIPLPQHNPPHSPYPPPSPPPLHAAHRHPSPHFDVSLMQHHVTDRIHLYESEYPRHDTFFNRDHLSRPPPPAPRENMRLPLLRECCRPSTFLRLETPHHGCEDRDGYEFPPNFNRHPRWDPRERQPRFTDDRQNYCDRSRFDGVYDRGYLSYKERDYAERRMGSGMVERDREIYNDGQWIDARRFSNINARGYESGIKRYYHENGWNNEKQLYAEVGVVEREAKFVCNNEALSQSWNRQEVVEGNSSRDRFRKRAGMKEDKGMLMRFDKKTRLLNNFHWQRPRMGEDKSLSVRSNKKKISPNKHARQDPGKKKVTGLLNRCKPKRKSMDNSGQRIGMVEHNELFIGSKKKAKLLNKDTLDRIELGKDCTSDGGDSKDQHLPEELSGFSVRKEEKEEPERTEAGNKNDREGKTLVETAFTSTNTPVSTASFPSLPKLLECSLNFLDESKRIVDNISGSPLDGSCKDITEPNLNHGLVLQSDMQGTYSELLGKSASSQNANVSDATNLGENAMKHALNFLVPNLVTPCSVSRLSKKRKVENLLYSESIMRAGNDSRIFVNADDQSVLWIPSFNISSSGVSNLSPFGGEGVIADSSNRTEGLVKPAEDGGCACNLADEVGRFPQGKLSAMQSTSCSFNQESTKPSSCIHNLASAACTGNSKVGSLLNGRIDDTNEYHFQKGLTHPENSFVNGPLKPIIFLEDHDVAGLPRCEESDISVVGSEINQLSLSSEDGAAVPKNAIITDLGPSDGDSVEFLRNQAVAPQHDVSAEDFKNSGGDAVTGCSNDILSTPGTANFLLSDCLLPADINDVHGSSFSGELLASSSPNRSCVCSSECHSDLRLSTKVEDQTNNSENEMIHHRKILYNGKSMPIDSSTISLGKSQGNAASDNLQVNVKISPYPCEDSEKVVKKVNERVTLSKKPTWAVPEFVPSHYSFKYSSASKSNFTHAAKPMTWQRNSNSAAVTIQPSTLPTAPGMKIGKTTQNAYIRKGNTLVRKPSNYRVTPPAFHGSGSSVYKLTSSYSTKIQACSGKNVAADASTLQNVDPVNGSEMPNALPLSHSGESLNCSTSNSESSLAVNSPGDGLPCKTVDALEEYTKNTMVPRQADSLDNSDGRYILDEGYSAKKMMYIKRKSYQLVATSNSTGKSMAGVDHVQPSSLSEGYYKSKKNQLIRAVSENHVKGDTTAILNRVLTGPSLTRRANRRQSGLPKPDKHSRLSFVWRLRDKNSPGKLKSSTTPQKVLPQILTWKRSMYWRSCKDALGIMKINSTVPTTGPKSLLSRKRGAIYTRSSHGYSLKMSKALGIGGSSLKWSKSMERNSKKVNEQVACAIAAALKRKKDGEIAVSTSLMSRNPVSRERIFRVGSERYKMDPTRRTLQRIIANEESSTSVLRSEKNVKVPFVPRRLLIGCEEYVRIGNGNQLVRNPKKRTRVLATEKVRWSLRTARLRLARKSKYCQFFTRFGKCNKDDGKCPYIHDPSKIVVCTKFLSGSCSDTLCKLTHQVIPERMQDCSYFIKGSCSNDSCPYRHVNVNPDSTVCQNFLRGYCAAGNECQMKHTYVCPAFEESGTCPQASTCKLHHPKKKTEKILAGEPNVVRGRYFDGGLVDVGDFTPVVREKLLPCEGKDDMVFYEGRLPDYISLDASDDEVDVNTASEQGCDDDMPVDSGSR